MTVYEQARRTEAINPGTVSIGDPVVIESTYQGDPIDHPAVVVDIDPDGTIYVDVFHDNNVTQRRMRV